MYTIAYKSAVLRCTHKTTIYVGLEDSHIRPLLLCMQPPTHQECVHASVSNVRMKTRRMIWIIAHFRSIWMERRTPGTVQSLTLMR